jgi:hypothetical protein
MPVISQKFKFLLGPLHLTLAVGDVNGNGVLDVSLTVSLVGVFQLPPFVVDLDAALAQQAIDGFKALGSALSKKKAV